VSESPEEVAERVAAICEEALRDCDAEERARRFSLFREVVDKYHPIRKLICDDCNSSGVAIGTDDLCARCSGTGWLPAREHQSRDTE
jgi:hypothetical protein